jgi:hypothetical protein
VGDVLDLRVEAIARHALPRRFDNPLTIAPRIRAHRALGGFEVWCRGGVGRGRVCGPHPLGGFGIGRI